LAQLLLVGALGRPFAVRRTSHRHPSKNEEEAR
jgi:hypothetical protein